MSPAQHTRGAGPSGFADRDAAFAEHESPDRRAAFGERESHEVCQRISGAGPAASADGHAAFAEHESPDGHTAFAEHESPDGHTAFADRVSPGAGEPLKNDAHYASLYYLHGEEPRGRDPNGQPMTQLQSTLAEPEPLESKPLESKPLTEHGLSPDPLAERVPAGDRQRATVASDAAALAPPVRTIVLDRAPQPVRPPTQREAVRRLTSAAGPERLRLEEVSVSYGPKEAVRGVSLSIHQGEVLALIGPSGCGKTTLLRTLNRLTELTPNAARAGRIALDGHDIHDLEDTVLRARVAMVFQQPNPFPMSIFDNVAFALREQSRRRPRRRELEPQVIDALRRAGLYDEVKDDLHRPALRLSGGQQQRLCIARAIAPRPEVLLMDEPCSALDPISTGVIEDLIHELRRELAVVIVTHNLAQAHRVADKVAFMYLGDLVEYGTAGQVFEEPRAPRTRDYVGGAFG